MPKNKNKNKKFSLDVSFHRAPLQDSGFVVDLRSKIQEQLPVKKTVEKATLPAARFWKARRVESSWPFFFKPLTKHRRGIFLDRRAEEIRDHLSAFEKKVFKQTFWGKATSFLLALFLIFIPFKLLAYYKLFDPQAFKARVMANSHLAIDDLTSAASAASQLDLKGASRDFSGAADHFLQAENDLKNIDESILQLAALSGKPELRLAAEGKRFLSAGVSASALGEHLSLALDGLSSKGNPSESWQTFMREGDEALSDSKQLTATLNEIDPQALPAEYRQQFLDLRTKAQVLNDALSEAIPEAGKLGELLGVNRDRRYLLIFENNNELRGGGGFMGSYALVDFSGGKVKSLEVPGGGTYDTKGGLKTFVKSPEALRLIAPRWFFWDANWFPDWALSAENIRWFYEKSGGPTVDGVIAFTPDIIDGLLEITGPIDLTSEYGVVIDSNNFYEVTQQITEKDNLVKIGQLSASDFQGAPATTTATSSSPVQVKQDLERNQKNKPKKIIGDLTAKILAELPKKINRDNIATLLALFEKNLAAKKIMFNFSDPALQKEMEDRNWAGRQEETTGDYLMVVDSNIAGGKSDYKITEKIEQDAEVQADGRILDTVRITRQHNGVKGDQLFGLRNVDWLRIYVPQGSQLADSAGFREPDQSLFKAADPSWTERPVIMNGEDQALRSGNGTMVYQENGKTVFANWLMLDPGTEESVEFSYYLPFQLSFSDQKGSSWLAQLNQLLFGPAPKFATYSLLVQKQPGASAPAYSSRFNLNNSQLANIWTYPGNTTDSTGWNQELSLDHDQSFGAVIQRR